MLIDYLPVLIYMIIAVGLVSVIVLLSEFLGKKTHSYAKDLPYECGIPPESNARGRYSARFYVVAMLFVIFDVETMFLFPWAILYRTWVAAHAGAFALISMLVFLGILLIGYVWIYKKGALDWA